jgi:hypothetical protein
MNETTWLTCADPLPMLDYLQGRASDRKLRLFAVSAYRLILPWITDSTSRIAMGVAEEFSDRLTGAEELASARATAYRTYLNSYANSIFAYAVADANAAHAAHIATRDVETVQPVSKLVALLRDLVGNPFRPLPSLDRGVLVWNEGTISRLAQRVYEQRPLPAMNLDSACLAVLADALEDAGCTERLLVEHLREPGLHYRGCWALDTILGRE